MTYTKTAAEIRADYTKLCREIEELIDQMDGMDKKSREYRNLRSKLSRRCALRRGYRHNYPNHIFDALTA